MPGPWLGTAQTNRKGSQASTCYFQFYHVVKPSTPLHLGNCRVTADSSATNTACCQTPRVAGAAADYTCSRVRRQQERSASER